MTPSPNHHPTFTKKTVDPRTAAAEVHLFEALRGPHIFTRPPKGQSRTDHDGNCFDMKSSLGSVPAPLLIELTKLIHDLDRTNPEGQASINDATAKALRQIGSDGPIKTSTMLAERIIDLLTMSVMTRNRGRVASLGNAKQAEFIAEAAAVAPSDDLASITTAADMLFDAVNKLLAECDDRESTPEIDAALDEVAECRNLYNDIRTKVLGPRRAGAED